MKSMMACLRGILEMFADLHRALINRVDELCDFTSGAERDSIIEGLRWIGLFSDNPATLQGNLLDTLCAELEKLMSFQPGERDLVMLQHKFVVEWKDGSKVTGFLSCSIVVRPLKLTSASE